MQPRLDSSKKWTGVPADFAAKVMIVFKEQFPSEADEGEFIVEGRIYAEEIILRVGYLENGRLAQINCEASMDYSQEKKNAVERLYLCIDAAASMMEEYFVAREDDDESEEMDLRARLDWPVRWRPFEIEDETVYLQASRVNTKLEDEADRLLGLADSALVQETESEDALSHAVVDTELAVQAQKHIRSGFEVV